MVRIYKPDVQPTCSCHGIKADLYIISLVDVTLVSFDLHRIQLMPQLHFGFVIYSELRVRVCLVADGVDYSLQYVYRARANAVDLYHFLWFIG